VDIPILKRPIYSRSSYSSVPLLSLIVSPASEQRPKSLVRSELSTSCIWDAAMFDREIDFPLSHSAAPSLVNLVTCLISIIFECFQYIFQVFSMRDSRARPGYIVLSFPAVFNGFGCVADMRIEKRCIIIDAE